ncbi:MAG TPA: phosphatidate cytidylyltransferase [Candidatus Faecousia intestinigallinarum]|nr:phosphatidate cytidylyltransferase [Candidatus Faecousia intestinigallinarum]
MKTRVITAAVLLPLLLIAVLFLPKVITAIAFGALAAAAAYEFLYNTALVQHPRLIAYSAAMAFLTALWSCYGSEYTWAMVGILAFFGVLFGEMMASHVKISVEKVAYCLMAGLLLPYLLSSVVRIHSWRLGRYYILIPFVLAFLSDTGAYFAGRAFGRHKLAPVISPNKTVEGMLGGILGAILGMLIYGVVVQVFFRLKVNYLYALVYGVLGSGAAVFGDLCFSVIKRQTGIKDYGNVIPGHGGVLDRFDSMMAVGPLAELLLLLIPVVY